MEWWNDGILVFKWILAILILSSILPVAGTLNQHCIILSEPQARTHYSTIPLFHHSNCERSELTWLFPLNLGSITISFVFSIKKQLGYKNSCHPFNNPPSKFKIILVVSHQNLGYMPHP